MKTTYQSVLTPLIAMLIAVSAIAVSASGQVGVGDPEPEPDDCIEGVFCRKCYGGCGPIPGTIKISCSDQTHVGCCCAPTGTLPTAGTCQCQTSDYCQTPPSGTQCR